jgi:hypothetical protein
VQTEDVRSAYVIAIILVLSDEPARTKTLHGLNKEKVLLERISFEHVSLSSTFLETGNRCMSLSCGEV